MRYRIKSFFEVKIQNIYRVPTAVHSSIAVNNLLQLHHARLTREKPMLVR